MSLILGLALRDLRRDRVHLICNVAVIVGIVLPILVLFGVKNGVYDMLIGRLLANPATLQIDTSGNHSFTQAHLDEVQGWPETRFATLKTRSLFDFVNVRGADGGAIQDATLEPSGTGDPRLPQGATIGPDSVVISTRLAQQAELDIGDGVLLITQAENRPRQLVIETTVTGIVPADQLGGRRLLADIETLDLVEAFYDGYALPDHDIAEGRALDTRIPDFEGLRVYARTLEDLAPLQLRVEAAFGINTNARTREVQSVLGLGRNLDLALLMTVIIATTGLAATLVFSFWAEIARKRKMVAILALIGLTSRQVAVFPLIQAAMTAMIALLVSFLLLFVCSYVADALFMLPSESDARLVSISIQQAVLIAAAVLAFVVTSSAFAVWQALKTDPAIILREEA
ncbi:MAG: FtsX-like permease family protein [Pseudomonadota bacterium]